MAVAHISSDTLNGIRTPLCRTQLSSPREKALLLENETLQRELLVLRERYEATDRRKAMHSKPPAPRLKSNPPANVTVLTGEDAYKLFADALTSGDGPAEIFLGGTPSEVVIKTVEAAIERLVKPFGELEFGPAVEGSWWRKLAFKISRRVGDEDIDKTKRAIEVQLLDRWEGGSAKNYADALSVLAESMKEVDFGFLIAKNVLVINSTDEMGRSVVRGRQLTSAEVLSYERGELSEILRDPVRAIEFVTSPFTDLQLRTLRSEIAPEPPPPTLGQGITS